MPAAAVIPAPIAYIKVVAVKKLVVEFLGQALVTAYAARLNCPFLRGKQWHSVVAVDLCPLL